MEHEFKIKIIDSDEKSLIAFGQILCNRTSLKIIKLLIEKESYTNEISVILKINVSLVIHHLKKLEKLGILEITEKSLVKRGKNHRFFRMNPYIFVSPANTTEDIINHGIQKFIF